MSEIKISIDKDGNIQYSQNGQRDIYTSNQKSCRYMLLMRDSTKCGGKDSSSEKDTLTSVDCSKTRRVRVGYRSSPWYTVRRGVVRGHGVCGSARERWGGGRRAVER